MKRRKDLPFEIFSTVCILLSVVAFAMMRKLTGDPVTKMMTDALVIFLLVVLNIAVFVLHEMMKQQK